MGFSRITTMAAVVAIVAVMGFVRMDVVVCDDDHHQLVKGSVECVDCSKNYDYSGIKVVIKCENSKKAVAATTKKDGSYEAEAHDHVTPTSNCHAKIFGGPNQLYASKKTMTSKITVSAADQSVATASTLPFAISCSRKLGTKCTNAEFGSSKTINIPFPPEYGLAPSSLYFPVMPIIGIP